MMFQSFCSLSVDLHPDFFIKPKCYFLQSFPWLQIYSINMVNITKYSHKSKYSYITGDVMLCLYADREKQWWHQQAFPWLHDARILFLSLLIAPVKTIWYSSIQARTSTIFYFQPTYMKTFLFLYFNTKQAFVILAWMF